MLRVWLTERERARRQPLFPTRTGRRLSRDAVERRVRTHAATAAQTCPSLPARRVHPHVLRHSCAMSLLQAGVDTSVIALWLGHAGVRSTDAYFHADITIKERALAPDHTVDQQPGPLPAHRQGPRLPRKPVICRLPQPRITEIAPTAGVSGSHRRRLGIVARSE